jgi:hypothetical protein
MYQRNSQEAFNNAKAKGLANPSQYMYMYSQGTKDYFKATMDRKYINFNQ